MVPRAPLRWSQRSRRRRRIHEAPGACRAMRDASVLVLVALAVRAHGLAEGRTILPVSLDCTRSAHTVEIAEAATEVLYCPEYFSNRTCCLEEEMTAVWEKVEDMLRFITRVLSDQKEELLPEGTEAFEGDPCAEYHARLFTSRSAAYRRARQA